MPPPVLYFLSDYGGSGYEACSQTNYAETANNVGLAVVFPDTSSSGIPDLDRDGDTFVGSGAGFYVDATAPQWVSHYKMYSYITLDLPEVVNSLFTVNSSLKSITGLSMGGHGAVVCHLKILQNTGRHLF